LDRPVEGESNESTRKPAGWLGRGGVLNRVEDVVNVQHYGPETAAQQTERGKRKAYCKGRDGGVEGVEDKKEGTTGGIEEQWPLYATRGQNYALLAVKILGAT
jgi:hypothetical protein